MNTIQQIKPIRAFLLYAPDDADNPALLSVYDHLKAQDVEIWSEANLLPGQTEKTEIDIAIENTNVAIVFLSKRLLNKEGIHLKALNWIYEKSEETIEQGLFIIPVKLDDCDLPNRIKDLNFVDISAKNKVKDAINKILAAIVIRANQIGLMPPQPKWELLDTDEWARLVTYYRSGMFERSENIFPQFEIKETSRQKSVHSKTLDAIFRGKKVIVLVGDAGTGKTIALQRLVNYLARQHDLTRIRDFGLPGLRDERIPLYIEFRKISTFKSIDEINKFCLKVIKKITGNKDLSSFEDLVRTPDINWIIFLDGVDELQNRKIAVPALRVRKLLTSRASAIIASWNQR
jgi:hypothetical protein